MTGLDTLNDVIIEIATIVTDKNLNIIAEGPVFAINQKKQILDSMDEWNTRQHNRSGLVDRVLQSNTSSKDAEVSTIKFLEKCNELMNLGGIINIEVPNHDDILLYYNSERYKSFFYHKAHIHYFTENSLMDACKIAGFEGSVNSFLYYPFFNHVFWLQNNKPQNSAREALFTPVPTKGTNVAELDINDFYKETEKKYNSLINKHKLGDCLVFQGKKV